jgi:ubiquinone/menaquinone biosynthesis C-methylase UbiE
VIDKRGLLASPGGLKDVVIELGCGQAKQDACAIGVDLIDSDAVDLVGDAVAVLKRFPDGSVRRIFSSHFLEHVDDAGALLDEMQRVVRIDGEIEIVVPHFSSPYYFSDPTHRKGATFGLYTMSYFATGRLFRRSVPGYVRREGLVLEDVNLRFKSPRPFFVRYLAKRIVGSLFNSTRYLQELWEENFCYLFPCYEIAYRLRRQREGGGASV